jgi:hypothetical protein
MVHRTRGNSVPLILLASMALVPFVVSLGACGGGKPPATAENEKEKTEGDAEATNTGEETDAGSAESKAAAEAPEKAPEKAAEAPAPANTGSSKVTTKTEAGWADCHGTAKLKGKDKDVSKDVAALSKACAKATKMKQVGKTLTGKQSDSGSPQSFPLKAAAKHCYRVYAAGGDGIHNLNVAIKDSAGNVAGEDSTDAATAVVLNDGAVCFKEADAATVVVSVGSGSGAFAAQIWGD